MKLIHDSTSYEANKDHIDLFREMYSKGFPDENEREDFDAIVKRVQGEKQAKEPHSIIVLQPHENKTEVIGGLIADWYENSKCIHLIYLLIDNNYREKGIAKNLINNGITLIKDWVFETKEIEIKNVFFESNDPEKTTNDNFDPTTRLEIFSGLGAKWIDMPYVQPPLDINKEKVDNLLLLSFAQFNAKGDKIPQEEISAFLSDLYAGLGVPEKNETLAKMKNKLQKLKNEDGDIVLKHIRESTFFKFRKASVTWHFIQKDTDKNAAPNSNHFSSFEKDLLNFQNQKKPPFGTSFIGKQIEAKVIFPEIYQYTSEGRTHIKSTKTDRISIVVIISISYTTIAHSGETIWHITIAPAKDQVFTECDLIKLSSLFGSSQEGSNVSNEIKIALHDGNPEHIKPLDLIGKLGFVDATKHLESTGTGIVQIDTSGLTAVRDIDSVDSGALFRAESRSSVNRQFAKALCGIILGIFDFNRMDDDEIVDTIQPIAKSDSSFTVLYRGTLLKISEKDQVMNAVSSHVVVNPYLLIPNMALAYNAHILLLARQKIDRFLNSKQRIDLKELESCEIAIRNVLNSDYLSDIFQYRSEKTIIETGNSERGINHIFESIKNKLEDLKELIEVKKTKRSNFSDALLNAFLSFIAIIQVNNLFIEAVPFKDYKAIIYAIEAFISMAIFFLIKTNKN